MDVQTATAISSETIQLRPEKLRLNPRYDVRPFSREHTAAEDERIQQLAISLEENGQIDNLLITPDYNIISGHRRYRAALLINERRTACYQGMFTLRCAIDKTPDPRRKAIVGNLHRRDMSAMDIAYLICQLRDENDWRGPIGTKRLAEWLGLKEQNILLHERLLQADKALQNHVHSGLIAMASALDILRATTSPEQQAKVISRAQDIQMEAKLDRSMGQYSAGKATVEEVSQQIQASKARIQAPAIVSALRELPTTVVRPSSSRSSSLSLTRNELLAAISSFDQEPFSPSAREFVRYLSGPFAQGKGSPAELTELFLNVNTYKFDPAVLAKSKNISN